MANDFLISKWKRWFSLFDGNNDGKVCYADMEKARDKFTKQHELKDDEKKEISEKFTKWWCEYVNWGKEELTVDEFAEYQNAAFKADKEKFVERIKKCQAEIGDFVDVAHDGFVSEKEALAILKAEGHEDEEKDKRFYAHFSPVDRKIPLDRLKGYWIHYLTSEDSSLPDPVQRAMEEGL
ncbi:sarcoplasmic calcium-binding protein-like isoform X1 [Ruditapes philippinarum]|uniref:sarcoplasmic calcium-binding protein-like isoform X1 n=1 Tax=Ruditapes philippinarum TaxID=129788 RepID=UPI00295B9F59|nr:sarcoplasmic calcium-binding protein-like isoform X1 [Ruditapes philippinarum]XP_060599519.1 sarcoplasmic calcium-binding protein-like isoform X1 [Ruditapes philippinarum]